MKYYFASDVHLGLPVGDARAREQRFVRWLDTAQHDATEIFLLGDVFDFWLEYKTAVPRGFVRTLGKLADITDRGIPLHFFAGNHDGWLLDYLPAETGVIVHRTPLECMLGNQRFYLAHGHHVGGRISRQHRLFANRFLQGCLRALHPRWGIAMGQRWSHRHRLATGLAVPFDSHHEWLRQFAESYAATHPVQQFIFGHRHTPLQCPAGHTAQLTLLGEWIHGCEYAVFDGERVELRAFELRGKN